jgi:hypothetical protein
VAANAAQATTPPGKATPVSDPKVEALQKQLIAAGAKITADGRMGPATRAAQKQFGGNVTDANQSSAETARLARANTGAATAVANQSSAETARLARSGTVAPATSPRPSVGLASQLEWDRQYAKTHNANGTPMGAQAATPAAGVPPRPSVGLASQLEWDRQYAKKPSTAPVTMGATNADRRDFEESVNRMRRLSTLLKG